MPIFEKEIIQGSDSWIKAKLGRVSASNASKIVTSTGKISTQREGYMHTLCAEILTGERYETFKSDAMSIGNEREDESRSLFEMMHNVSVEKVGLIYKDETKTSLCSPDGLLPNKQGLELKNVMPKTQIGNLLKKKVAPDYFMQIQFSMWVTGFESWHYFTYSPGLPVLDLEVERDEKTMSILDAEIPKFIAELYQIVDKLK